MSLRIPRSAPSFPTLGLTLAAHPSFPTLDLTTSEGRGSGNGNGESSPFPAAWISTMAISRAPFPTVTLKNGFLYIAIPFMCMVFSAGSTPWLNKLLIHVTDRLAANGFCVFQRQLVGLSSIPINGRREANQSNCTLQGLLIMLGARFFFQHSDSEQIFSFLSPNLHCNVYQNGTCSYLCIFFKEQSSYCL